MEQTIEGSRPKYEWAVPASLGIPPDRLRLQLNFYHQAVQMNIFGDDKVTTKLVSALDISHSLATELSYGTGLLPNNTLWWQNTSAGPVTAIFEPPRVRVLAMRVNPMEPPLRFKIPLPGFIFLCTPGKAPAVYAVKHKPEKETDWAFKAPLFNVYQSGQSCGGSNKYPTDINLIVGSFFTSFFSPETHGDKRSNRFATLVELWKSLDGKAKYPLKDLVKHGTIGDLIKMVSVAGWQNR